MIRSPFWILLAVVLAVAWARPGHAQQDSPFMQAIKQGQAMKRLPSWLTLSDTFTVRGVGGRAYLCITDKETGQRWTTWGAWTKVNYALQLGRYPLSADSVATTYDDDRVCWPDLPDLNRPTVIGEPVYGALIWLGPKETAPLDWEHMNRDFVIRASVPGEPCAEPWSVAANSSEHDDPKVGWYGMPDGGVARCRAP